MQILIILGYEQNEGTARLTKYDDLGHGHGEDFLSQRSNKIKLCAHRYFIIKQYAPLLHND